MVGRVKFQVQAADGRWRTAYSTPELLFRNEQQFIGYGIKVRIAHPAWNRKAA